MIASLSISQMKWKMSLGLIAIFTNHACSLLFQSELKSGRIEMKKRCIGCWQLGAENKLAC
jgi:hypothetical protein